MAKNESNPPASATCEVDADQILRMLHAGKVDTDGVFQRVFDGTFNMAAASAAVKQYQTDREAAAAAAAAAKNGKELTVKVSVKGGGKNGDCKGGNIGIYGLQTQYPFGTYAESWLKAIPVMPMVLRAIETDPNVTAKNRPLAEVREAARQMRLKLETIFPSK